MSEGARVNGSLEQNPMFKFKRRLDLIDINRIVPNPNNPREPIGKKEVVELRESIHAMGVLVPVVVYEDEITKKFVLIEGERRWRACKELAREDSRFSKIPANIIEKPLSDIDHLRTMFNIHQKREEWSTAAKALAVSRLLDMKGEMDVKELIEVTGLTRTSINDAMILRGFPKHIMDRCLRGDLAEFYPILLGRNLQTIERVFPDLMSKYNWHMLSDCFIGKVDKGYIKVARDFLLLSRMARTCVQFDSEQLFEKAFVRMLNEEAFTPKDASKMVERELGYKLEEAFRANCKDFLGSFESYAKNHQDNAPIAKETMRLLENILAALEQFVKRRTRVIPAKG